MEKHFQCKYVAANVITQYGNSIHFVAITWLIYQMTQSASMIGVILGLCFLPRIIISYGYTRLTINYEHKNLIVISDILRCMLVLIIPIYHYIGITNSLTTILVIEMICAGLGSIFSVSSMTLIKSNVSADKLITINSNREIGLQIATVAGAVTAGLIISQLGVFSAIIFNALTFAASALIFSSITTQKALTPVDNQNIDHHLSFKKLPIIGSLNMLLLALYIICLPAILFDTVMTEITSVQLDGNSLTYALLEATYAVGALLSAFASHALSRRKKQNVYAIYLMLTLMLLSLCIAFMFELYFALLITFLLGFIGITLKVHFLTQTQRIVPARLMAQAQGYMQCLANVFSFITFVFIGVCSSIFSILSICSMLSVAGSIMIALYAIASAYQYSNQHYKKYLHVNKSVR